jgi:hypothetical protein
MRRSADHVRVYAVVFAQVDLLDGRAGEAGEPGGEFTLASGEAVDGAVVVGVDVEVEDPRRRDGRLEPLEHGPVAPLADVRDRHEQRRRRVVAGHRRAVSRRAYSLRPAASMASRRSSAASAPAVGRLSGSSPGGRAS